MVITLTGSNPFSLRQKLNKLIGDFVEEYGDLALERIDADEVEAQTILDAVQNLPFLATRKMVVVRNISANKIASEKIEQIIDSAFDDIDLILHEPDPDKRTAYYKVLKSKTQLEEFNDLDVRQLPRWLVEEAQKRGGKITQSDANYLVERVGANQSLLSNELDKLLIYKAAISRGSIDLLTEPTPQSKVFDLLDAAFGTNKNKALELYEEQRAQRVEPQAILAMITWQLQLLALTKYAEGKTASEVAKDLGMNPYPVTKASSLSRKIDDEKLKEMVEEAFKIDLKSKTSSLNLDEALKTYIVML